MKKIFGPEKKNLKNFKNPFLKTLPFFLMFISVVLHGAFHSQQFPEWPFTQYQVSAVAYTKHMLGAQHCIQYYGEYKAS